MLEAAQLETPVSLAMTSVSPMALDVPAADLADGLRWSRSEVDPKAFKPSRTAPALAALLASCVLVAVSLLGAEVPALVANASLQQEVTVMPVAPAPRKVARPAARVLELLRATKVVEARLTPDQKRRLLERDCATRTQRPKRVEHRRRLDGHPGGADGEGRRVGAPPARGAPP